MTNVTEPGGEMPTRGMNDPSPMSGAQAATQPGNERAMAMRGPQAVTPPGNEAEMAMRDMNAPTQAPMAVPGDSAREREKLAVYRREHPELANSQVGSMPGPEG